jgi:lysozyme
MDFARAAVGIGAGLFLYIAFKRWQESLQPGTFQPLPPAPQWLPAPLYAAAEGVFSTIAPMRTSAAGRVFIQQKEGFSLQPYADAAGHSIYWGHYIQPGETFLHTMADAAYWFDKDLAKAEAAIARYVTVPLQQGQYDAIADFIYNEGVAHFAGSTLLQKLNAGDYAGASGEFSRWVYSQGQKLQALIDRRAAEVGEWNAGSVTA